MINCPNCSSSKIVKNGHIHNRKQRFKCNECNRQFIENPQKITINQEKRELIDRLLLEKISLAGIARAVQVSESSRFAADRPGGLGSGASALQTYVNEKYSLVPREIDVTAKKKGN